MDVDGLVALQGAFRNKSRKYPKKDDARFRHGTIFPNFTPSFSIPADSTVFTIGSCFARNVEHALVDAGLDVPTANYAIPEEEASGRPNRVLNQYNPATMLQCLKPYDDEKGIYDIGDGKFLDLLLSTGPRPASKERVLERRNEISSMYSAALEKAQTVIITLGLIEVWYDETNDVFLNDAPPPPVLKSGNFRFRRLSVDECMELLKQVVAQIEGKNIILTVSPVPLQVTFSGNDGATANAYSKAVLRVVAEHICSQFSNVDYLPSYEVVSIGGMHAMGNDNIHVKASVVEQIVKDMLEKYVVN